MCKIDNPPANLTSDVKTDFFKYKNKHDLCVPKLLSSFLCFWFLQRSYKNLQQFFFLISHFTFLWNYHITLPKSVSHIALCILGSLGPNRVVTSLEEPTDMFHIQNTSFNMWGKTLARTNHWNHYFCRFHFILAKTVNTTMQLSCCNKIRNSYHWLNVIYSPSLVPYPKMESLDCSDLTSL